MAKKILSEAPESEFCKKIRPVIVLGRAREKFPMREALRFGRSPPVSHQETLRHTFAFNLYFDRPLFWFTETF